MIKSFSLHTHKRNEFVAITPQVQSFVKESGVLSGLCVVYIPHTTAGITINENADPAVKQDITSYLSKLIPLEPSFTHSEGNSDAHIKASLMGFSVHLIIEKGQLVLGTWQELYFCEFDGPRDRTIYVKILREGN